MKKVVSLILVVVMSMAVFSGCGKTEKTGSTNNKEKITLRITYNPGELGKTGEKDPDVLFADFYKKHPNVEVVFESGGTALLSKIAAGDAPDIVRINNLWDLPSYVNKGLALPLDDYLKKSKLYDEKDIYPMCIDMFKYDGKNFGKGHIYGLPKDWSMPGVWVNKKMLESAGLEVPTKDNPLDYETLMNYAKVLSKKDGNAVSTYGYAINASVFLQVETMLGMQGLSFWKDDFSGTTIKSKKTRKALEYFLEMQKNGYTGSTLYPMSGNGDAEFAEGKTAILGSSLYAASVFLNNPERSVDLDDMVFLDHPILANKKDEVKFPVSATGAIIMNTTKHPDLAFELYEYIHLGKLAEDRAASGFNLAINKSTTENAEVSNPFIAGVKQQSLKMAENDYFMLKSNPYVSKTAVEAVFQKYWDPVLFGNDTLDHALTVIDKEIKSLIDEGKELTN